MLKSELPKGHLPGEQETEAWLRAEEFDGFPHYIPLTLAGMVSHLSRGKDLHARGWCILAIYGSPQRTLSTEDILDALIKHVKKFGDDPGAATPQGPHKKRRAWAVRASNFGSFLSSISHAFNQATMVSALSTNTIFVQKSQDGQPSCTWRLDVRAQDYHCKRTKCQHQKQNV